MVEKLIAGMTLIALAVVRARAEIGGRASVGRPKTQKRPTLAEEHAVQANDGVATHIEQTLQGLILTAEQADLRFLGYLLRMAHLEAGGVQHSRRRASVAFGR